jgi:hypothetical protein
VIFAIKARPMQVLIRLLFAGNGDKVIGEPATTEI